MVAPDACNPQCLICLPDSLIRSADRHVVIVSGETAESIEQHFQQLEADPRARLEQVKGGCPGLASWFGRAWRKRNPWSRRESSVRSR
jgi:hypothetical protein